MVPVSHYCKGTSTTLPNRRIALKFYRYFNETIFLCHFYFDSVNMIQNTDVATRISSIDADASTDLENAIYNIKLLWFAQFWHVSSNLADLTFHDSIVESI